MSTLTEEDAAIAFARAWNRLEPDDFLALLAPDARYASQWVAGELVGAPVIEDYLRGKMRTVRANGVNDPEARVRVELGRTTKSFPDRPCALMTQGESDPFQAAVLFDVRDGKVARYDLCIPGLLGPVGVFPA
ncbi:MAG: nuclear transport factor 2 family protein [Proteobacteria bacterium]|nr:nuclear transport factor 2 family protein [Pseudomonadota bacterium]